MSSVPARSVVWPTGGSAVSPVDGAVAGAARAMGASPAKPGGLPVSARGAAASGQPMPRRGGAAPDETGPAAPRTLRIAVAEQAAAGAAGVNGVVFTVARADGGSRRARVALDIDTSAFRDAYGGDYGARLRLVALPMCALRTPQVPACRVQTPVASTDNPATGVVSADVVDVAGDPVASAAGPLASDARSAAVAGAQVLAVAAGSASQGGNWKATSLGETGMWASGTQGGEFTYRVPMKVPAPAAGPRPDVALLYSSGSVDGRTASKNAQPSVVGEGWELSTLAFVERRFQACADAGKPTGDLCYLSDDVTISLNGTASDVIVDDATGAWKLVSDPGWRVERFLGNPIPGEQHYLKDFSGEYWKVTTQDGSQYFFGKAGRPGVDSTDLTHSVFTTPVFHPINDGRGCYNATWANSWCWRAWRWNLDYVIDAAGNSMTLFYEREGTFYGANNNSNPLWVTRGGYLTRVEYGTRAGSEAGTTAPYRVRFEHAWRCLAEPCDGHPENWPDTPWDQWCDGVATPCQGRTSPTFWTAWRLNKVVTEVSTGGGYQGVDEWQLRHIFPATGDNLSPALYLGGVTHTGLADSTRLAEPTMWFNASVKPNRVFYGASIGVEPNNKYRIFEIFPGTGSRIGVEYHDASCASRVVLDPDHNPYRCYPQYVTANDGGDSDPSGWTWFHKYITKRVTVSDLSGGGPDEAWSYSYSNEGSSDTQLWHHDGNYFVPGSRRTWSQWRGFATVYIEHGGAGGPISATTNRYYRGMHGDRVDGDPMGNFGSRVVTASDSLGPAGEDYHYLRGFLRESMSWKDGTVVAKTVYDQWGHYTGQQTVFGQFYATIVRTDQVDSYTWVAATSSWRHSRTSSTIDTYGLVTDVRDHGDLVAGADDTCTHTDYARNTATYLINLPSQTITTDCTANPGPANHLSGSQTLYDNATTVDAAPDKGLPTTNLALASFNGTAKVWKQATRTVHDSLGRSIEEYDALDRRTSTAYVPPTGSPVTAIHVTNPVGHVNRMTLDPRSGLPVVATDANGKVTTARYDALGRLVKVWFPGRATSLTPNVEFGYILRDGAGANSITTKKLGPNGNQITTVQLLDGRQRLRQTQAQAPQANGGRVITDVIYNRRGLKAKESVFWNNASGPNDTLVGFNDVDVLNQHRFAYDELERPTVDAFYSANVLRWQTTTGNDGDRTTVVPPAGGIATMTLTNAQGKTTELRQYLSGAISGGYQATTYAYDRLSRPTMVTDPAGNQWTTSYDLRGHAWQTADPDKGRTELTHDDAGQVLTSKDDRDVILAYTYDTLGRKTGLYETSTAGTRRAAWTYDTVAKGHLTSSTRFEDGNAYTRTVTGYDDSYQPLGTTVTIPPVAGLPSGDWTVSTTYHVDGSVATNTYPAAGGLPAETVTNTYDNTGNLLTVASPLATYVAATSYHNFGGVYQRVLGAGGNRVRQTTAIDEATGRLLTNATHTEHQSNPNTWVEQLTDEYLYNNAGIVTSIRETTGAGTTVANQCFTYDGVQQLVEAWTTTAATCQANPGQTSIGGPESYWTSYRYNAVGNRTAETKHAASGDTSRNYTYPGSGPTSSRPHALTSGVSTGATPGTDTNTHDAAGNTKTRTGAGRPTQTLTWDAEGRLASVADSGGTTSYVYDSEGERLVARDPGGATVFLAGYEVRKVGTTITPTRFYSAAGATVASRTGIDITWFASDHHGTAHLAVNGNDLSTIHRRTDPFGNARGNEPAWPNTRSFVNGTRDNTGLIHLGAREYEPPTGRFISADPVADYADPQHANGYTYAHSSPVSKSDSSGLRVPDCEATYSNCRTGAPLDPCHGYYPTCGNRLVPPTTNTPYDKARGEYFGPGKPYDQRKIYQTNAYAAGHGIIVMRFFIPGSWAVGPFLYGDDRGYSDDPSAPYRIAIAWDTETGQISYTVVASCGAVAGCNSQDEIVPGGANDLKLETGAPGLAPEGADVFADYSGLNSILPCCSTNGRVEVLAMTHYGGGRSVQIKLSGDDYPSFEAYDYKKDGTVTNLAKADMGWDGGTDTLPPSRDRNLLWVDGELR